MGLRPYDPAVRREMVIPMPLSLTPFLLAAEFGFLFFIAWRCGRRGALPGSALPIYTYLLWLIAYGIASSVAGAYGLYVCQDFLSWLPGLWLQLITVGVFVVPVILSTTVRNSLRRVVDTTPLHWFGYFHGMRIAALGTAAKTASGDFPVYFELFVGIPDLLFGISALWIGSRLRRGMLSERGFMQWNLLGALIIVPSAPVLLQLGLPGPFYVFDSVPDARAVFTYPMSIAPMIGVPMFVLMNFLLVWRLWERRAASDTFAAPGPDRYSTARTTQR